MKSVIWTALILSVFVTSSWADSPGLGEVGKRPPSCEEIASAQPSSVSKEEALANLRFYMIEESARQIIREFLARERITSQWHISFSNWMQSSFPGFVLGVLLNHSSNSQYSQEVISQTSESIEDALKDGIVPDSFGSTDEIAFFLNNALEDVLRGHVQDLTLLAVELEETFLSENSLETSRYFEFFPIDRIPEDQLESYDGYIKNINVVFELMRTRGQTLGGEDPVQSYTLGFQWGGSGDVDDSSEDTGPIRPGFRNRPWTDEEIQAPPFDQTGF